MHDSFYIGNDHFRLEGRKIRIPRLGWVRMREALRFTGRVVSATVSRIADKWFVSLNVELGQPPDPCESQAGVGVDLGIRKLATMFNGTGVTEVEGPRPHYRMACIRQDALHKLTTYLTATYRSIAIEDLDVKGMMGNRHLARSISDMGFHEFRRQLEYKAKMHGNHVELAYRWFPSSKRCSWCCVVNDDLTLSDRDFVCSHCGRTMDRDLNAAINLFSTVSSTGFEVCGEDGSGSGATLSETGLSEAETKPCTDLCTF